MLLLHEDMVVKNESQCQYNISQGMGELIGQLNYIQKALEIALEE